MTSDTKGSLLAVFRITLARLEELSKINKTNPGWMSSV